MCALARALNGSSDAPTAQDEVDVSKTKWMSVVWGRITEPWIVRAGEGKSMSVRWYTVVIDCQNVAEQARWWAEVLDWRTVYEAPDEVVIVPPHALEKGDSIPVEERGPGLVFVPVPEGKQVKNRLHIDLAPRATDDQATEVERLVSMGATRIDVGQSSDVGWVVLADPEGNEFCVLSSRD